MSGFCYHTFCSSELLLRLNYTFHSCIEDQQYNNVCKSFKTIIIICSVNFISVFILIILYACFQRTQILTACIRDNSNCFIWNMPYWTDSTKRIIHSVFQTRKSRGGRSAIGWQAAAPACQPIADRPPRDFRVWKTLWIIRLRVTDCYNIFDFFYFSVYASFVRHVFLTHTLDLEDNLEWL